MNMIRIQKILMNIKEIDKKESESSAKKLKLTIRTMLLLFKCQIEDIVLCMQETLMNYISTLTMRNG